MSRILVTGAAGLIGTALVQRMGAAGHEVVSFDIANTGPGRAEDIRDLDLLTQAVRHCSGVVHLGAVSRVVWGERDPGLCHQVNVVGTSNVLAAVAQNGAHDPWILAASSREVYGQAAVFPVAESAPLSPINAYARSKVAVEKLVASAQKQGARASVIRFSSVYGSTADHRDRVAPAFARLAAEGSALRVDGADTTLDFTHIEDVTAGLHLAVESLEAGRGQLPPLHLVSGEGTRLLDLAHLAIRAAGQGSVQVTPTRSYDVAKFIGDPARAMQVLGWRTRIPLEAGMSRLVSEFRARRR